jgi:hypothetical protein
VSTKIDYEVQEYEHYATIAQSLLDLGLIKEAGIYETLADLSYEKAYILSSIERIRESKGRKSSFRK